MKTLFKSFSKIFSKNNQPQLYPDDTFLVSFPKSGNTWIRFIVANIIKTDSEPIDFHRAVEYVPELGLHNDILKNLPRPRVLKSHKLYDDSYPNVIYIVRDPRDVYVSYYYYMKKQLPENTSFAQFLRMSDMYPSRWHMHVQDWIDQPNVALVVKYEDMLEDTHRETQKIAQVLFGHPIDPDKLNMAVDNSSFDRMKSIEKDKGRPFTSEEAKKKSTVFVRKGQAGDWKNYFTPQDEQFLIDETGPLMQRFGYI